MIHGARVPPQSTWGLVQQQLSLAAFDQGSWCLVPLQQLQQPPHRLPLGVQVLGVASVGRLPN
jgi:hypothetical protein